MKKTYVVVNLVLAAIVLLFVAGCNAKQVTVSKTNLLMAQNTVEQKLCPIMDKPTVSTITTEYDHKVVAFCCSPCVSKFETNPNVFIDKLPQFSGLETRGFDRRSIW